MVSFIVIGKNEGERLLKCFKALLLAVTKNSIEDYEIIFVDSNSTDNSIDIAKEIENTRIFIIEGECNAAIGRNIGEKESKGEILVFIDGDMEIEVDFLSYIIKDNQLIYPFVSGIYSHYYIDMNNPIKTTNKNRTFTGGFFVIKRKLWLQIHGMDNKLKVNEDIDLNIRLSKINISPLVIPQICIIHNTAKNKLFYNFIDRTINYRYVSILARKHFLSLIYWRGSLTLRMNYTSYFLFIALCVSFVNPISLVIYLLIVATRALIKDKKNGVLMFLHYMMRDIIFIASFILFWPEQPKISYKEVLR